MSVSVVSYSGKSHDLNVEVVEGDIATQPDIDAIVNAARPDLESANSIARAIHRAAGAALGVECRRLAPVRPGGAVMTPAFALPNRNVVHCVAPRYGVDEPVEELLSACYRRSVELAEGRQLASLAFPALATRSRYLPVERCARLAGLALLSQMRTLQSVRLIRFVLHGPGTVRAYRRVLSELLGQPGRAT